MLILKEIKAAFLNLFFPHCCAGCGSDRLHSDSQICFRCLAALPETVFERLPGNPVEKTFWGRIPLQAATAHYYFTKRSMVQHILHQLKYKGNRELGWQLGRIMGLQLLQSCRFHTDGLVPLPLFPDRERKRGYNQATLLCEGIAEILRVPVLQDAVTRPLFTSTQTRKGRMERWKNMEGKFLLTNEQRLRHQKILLVDDVITTGATLEACGTVILEAEAVELSVAALCYAAR